MCRVQVPEECGWVILAPGANGVFEPSRDWRSCSGCCFILESRPSNLAARWCIPPVHSFKKKTKRCWQKSPGMSPWNGQSGSRLNRQCRLLRKGFSSPGSDASDVTGAAQKSNRQEQEHQGQASGHGQLVLTIGPHRQQQQRQRKQASPQETLKTQHRGFAILTNPGKQSRVVSALAAARGMLRPNANATATTVMI